MKNHAQRCVLRMKGEEGREAQGLRPAGFGGVLLLILAGALSCGQHDSGRPPRVVTVPPPKADAGVPADPAAQTPPELVLQHNHTLSVHGAAFSPDGRFLFTGGEDRVVRQWDVGRRSLLRVRGPVSEAVLAVAVSPDGKTVVAGGSQGKIWVWETATGALAKTFSAHDSSVKALAFNRAGTLLASGGHDGFINFWNVGTWQSARRAGHGAERDKSLRPGPPTLMVSSLAFLPDGKFLVSGSREHQIQFWDMGTLAVVRSLPGHAGGVEGVAVSPDGKWIASSGQDKAVRLADAVTGKAVWEVQLGYGGPLAFSPDGRKLYTGCGSPRILVADSGITEATLGPDSNVGAMALSADGKILAAMQGGVLTFYDTAARKSVHSFARWPHYAGIWPHQTNRTAVYSPDGKRIAVADRLGGVAIWDAQTGSLLKRLPESSAYAHSLRFLPDGRLVTGGGGATVQIFDLEGEKPAVVLPTGANDLWNLDVSPDGGLLVLAKEDWTVDVWDLATQKRLHALPKFASAVRRIGFGPDGKLLALVDSDGTVQLWDPRAGKLVRKLARQYSLEQFAFSPAGDRIVAGTVYQSIHLFDVKTGQKVGEFAGGKRNADGLAFAADGRSFWSLGNDGVLELRPSDGGPPSFSVAGVDISPVSFSMSPDGRRLLTLDTDGTLRVLRASDGRLLVTLLSLPGKEFLAFTPDGRFHGSPEGLRLVAFRVGGALADGKRFEATHHRPELVARALTGD